MEWRSALFRQMSPTISRGATVTVLVGGTLFEAIKAQKTNRTTRRQNAHTAEGRRGQGWGYPAPRPSRALGLGSSSTGIPTATVPVLWGNGRTSGTGTWMAWFLSFL